MKEGPANTWAFNRRNLAETLNPANPDYGTFDQLEKDFYQVFVSPDFNAETRQNLLSIRQGQDEPIATFVDRFKTLAVQAGITEYSTLSETFKRGIHGPLIDHINSRAEIPTQMETTTANNVTTTGWYKAAIQAETALKQTRGLNQAVQSRYNNFRNNFRPAIPPHFARGPPPRPFAPQYRPFVPNRPSPLNPNQPPRNPGFAPNFRSNNLSQICFRCNRPGHIAKYCSLPPPAQSNTVGIRQMETPMEDFTNYYAYYPEPQQTQEQSYHYTPEVYYETPAPASAEETQPPPLFNQKRTQSHKTQQMNSMTPTFEAMYHIFALLWKTSVLKNSHNCLMTSKGIFSKGSHSSCHSPKRTYNHCNKQNIKNTKTTSPTQDPRKNHPHSCTHRLRSKRHLHKLIIRIPTQSRSRTTHSGNQTTQCRWIP